MVKLVDLEVYPYNTFKEKIRLAKNELKNKKFTDIGSALMSYIDIGNDEDSAYFLCKNKRNNYGR